MLTKNEKTHAVSVTSAFVRLRWIASYGFKLMNRLKGGKPLPIQDSEYLKKKSESSVPRYNRTDEYLFSGRQIEDQVSHYKCLRWTMEKRDIFVFEAREVAVMR
jgi:hypothetical protein